MLCGELVADLERYRPAIPAESSESEVLSLLEKRSDLRLGELYREFRVEESDSDLSLDTQFALYQRDRLAYSYSWRSRFEHWWCMCKQAGYWVPTY